MEINKVDVEDIETQFKVALLPEWKNLDLF